MERTFGWGKRPSARASPQRLEHSQRTQQMQTDKNKTQDAPNPFHKNEDYTFAQLQEVATAAVNKGRRFNTRIQSVAKLRPVESEAV